jgi:hypothetical protein
MPDFNPFGQLTEVQRYKTDLAMKQDQIARQNALQMQQLNRQARLEENAIARAMQEQEAGQRRQMGLEMTLGNVPPERRQEELVSRGYLKEAGQLRKAIGAPASEPSPYKTPIKTSQGWVSYDNRSGEWSPITMSGGGRALPIAADVGLAGRKVAATKDAERVAKLKSAKPKAEASLRSFDRGSENVLGTIDEALKLVSGTTTGPLGKMSRGIPGTPAFNLGEKIKTIIANKAFGFLAEMRANSPTGGAVGQLSERELELMGLVEASLNPDLSPGELTANLKKVKKLTKEMQKAAHDAYRKDFAEVTTKAKPSGSANLKAKYGLE